MESTELLLGSGNQKLQAPSPDSSRSRTEDFDGRYLCVDETKRPRANSDPVGLHLHIVPEITVTGDDDTDTGPDGEEGQDSYLIPPSPRRRAHTCPEDMFLARKGRPPTPPPVDTHLAMRGGRGGKRFSFNFTSKDLNGVSFAHHRLSKVAEDVVDAGCGDKKGGKDSPRLQTHFSFIE